MGGRPLLVKYEVRVYGPGYDNPTQEALESMDLGVLERAIAYELEAYGASSIDVQVEEV